MEHSNLTMNHSNLMMNHSNMHNMKQSMHMMKMYFQFSSKATILFKEWDIDSIGGMVWSCVVVFILAILYEGFKVFREVLRNKYATSVSYNVSENGLSARSKGPQDVTVHINKNLYCNWHHLLQSFLHMIQVAFSYFLMLIAMTFNGWLFISVCIGAGFGHFIFSWKVNRPYDVNEHCH
ncbi:high affinity copper uptake protein 1-like isoform X2 [Xenia sp. Carnegie-2017]|uniref:high affinity copper uptake protein 1-like isoform X2 n=1 Tax=Xenia sp. Carnegie-2017 TaxID=2897299 RepID=UPI001F0349AB|nr:high affinity copper uptake protein 1-like isoform X2 [Xenia sp. Carnegie-2017]